MLTFLQGVLSDPKLLSSFESFLLNKENGHSEHVEKDLLFIQAMYQLEHEIGPKKIEGMLHRIYDSFLKPGAVFELSHVTTSKQVKHDIDALQWSIVTCEDALELLSDTKNQVLAVLYTHLEAFVRTTKKSTSNSIGSIGSSSSIRPRSAPDLMMSSRIHGPRRQVQVAIIGGGFTGFTVASILDRMPLFDVTLIDTKDAFEYTPGIVRRIVRPTDKMSTMRVRHDAYVRNGRVVIGYATDIGHDAQSVQVRDETIYFDYLVIATGGAYSSPKFKSTDILSAYRLAGLDQACRELRHAKRVLIIGGGLVGCELASEIANEYPDKERITLVESHATLLSRSSPDQQAKVMAYLQDDLGVEVVVHERLMELEDGRYFGSTSGRLFEGFDKVFMATGTKPHTEILLQATNEPLLDSCVDMHGRIKVKPTLQIDHWKYQHLFAGGDNTNVVEEKTGYAATLAGVCIARNICRMVKGKEPLRQGTKGTLPAPGKPLHNIMVSHHPPTRATEALDKLKKHLGFLNHAWAALKCYDEQEYLQMVNGEAFTSSMAFGRPPRRLNLNNRITSAYQF